MTKSLDEATKTLKKTKMIYIECSYLKSYITLAICSTMCRINRQHPMMGPSIQTCLLRRLWGHLIGRLRGHRLSGRLRGCLRGCRLSGRLRRDCRIWRGGQMVRRCRHRLCRRPSELYERFWTSMDCICLFMLAQDIWTCMNLYRLCMNLYGYCEYCHIWNACNVYRYMYKLPVMSIVIYMCFGSIYEKK